MASQSTITLSQDQPLIGIPFKEDGKEVIRYFSSEETAQKAVEKEDSKKKALALAGAWSDLDWKETLAALDRIRHESKPTPPIDEI